MCTEILSSLENIVWGPFYVENAPFRAKISPVYSVGIPLIVKGRVFGLDTRRPIRFASIDIWHASPEAQYDYHEVDPSVKYPYKEEVNKHGRSSHFDYRSRLVTDEQGQYEYETVKPVPYFDGEDSTWRCPHIHYYVQASGYKPLITQLYFKGEEKNDIGMKNTSLLRRSSSFCLVDHHIDESTTIELESIECQRSDASKLNYLQGEFDVIMATN